MLLYILDESSQVNKEEVEAILIKDRFIKYLSSSCGSWSMQELNF